MSRAAGRLAAAWLASDLLLSVACREPCETVGQPKTAESPGGFWVAQTRQVMCDYGLASDLALVVELRRTAERDAVVVLAPEGQWTGPESVELHWVDAASLDVVVPNRTVVGNPLREYDGVHVRVLYRDDDPADREAWLRARAARRAWLRDGKLRQSSPEPVMPSPPAEGQ